MSLRPLDRPRNDNTPLKATLVAASVITMMAPRTARPSSVFCSQRSVLPGLVVTCVVAMVLPSSYYVSGIVLRNSFAPTSSLARIGNGLTIQPLNNYRQQKRFAHSSGISISSSSAGSTTRLYHMGHSHSHDHYSPNNNHQHHNDDDEERSFLDVFTTGSTPGTILTTQRIVRRIALWLFCWVATCGPTVIGKRQFPTLAEWMAFAMTSAMLSSADRVRRAVRTSLHKLKGFRDGIVKHAGAPTVDSALVGPNGASVMTAVASVQDTSEADRVTWIGVIINIVLSVGKLAVGIVQHSSVLIADAGHSLSDLVSDFITLWSVQVARLPPDDDHPYGHSKFEAIGSLFLSLTLLATGVSVGIMANKQLVSILWPPNKGVVAAGAAAVSAIPVPGPVALFMAGLSIVSKEWLYRITKRVGEKLNSPVVLANAWHHRSDAYSSVLALLSIAWAMMGYPAADAAAGMLVAGMICMTGGDILVESVKQLSDSTDETLHVEISNILSDAVMVQDGDVIGTTSIRARQVGSSAVADVTVEIPPVLSTTATRAVEERVRRHLLTSLEKQYGRQMGSVTATVHAKPNLPTMSTQMVAENHQRSQQEQPPTIGEGHASHVHDHNDDGSSSANTHSSVTTLSASLIEQKVRQQALLMYPQIHSVEGVTVHYSSASSAVTVDVNIRIAASGTTTLEQLQRLGQELKIMLEESLPEIDSARLYLDLNAVKSDSNRLMP